MAINRSPAKTYRSAARKEICHFGFTSRGNKRILIVSEGEQRNPSDLTTEYLKDLKGLNHAI
jgi:hypothetical protein